jgi:hypothetical protein
MLIEFTANEEEDTPYLIIRKSIENGEIIDILRLKQCFYETLKECFEEEEKEGETVSAKEVILQMMSNRFQSCSEESMTMKMILETVGFDSQFAEDFSNHIEADPLDMSLWDWIHSFVVSTMDRLWMKCSGWPKDETYITVERRYIGYGLDARNKDFRKKDISDFLEDGFEENLLKILVEEIKERTSEDFEFWYHGTCPEYANAIIWRGIKLTQGKEYGNYSHSDGFYLTADLDFAMQAAFKKYCIPNFKNNKSTVEEVAVVVFAFEKKEIEHLFPLAGLSEQRETEIGIDLRLAEGDSAELKSQKDNRVRKIVHFFSHGAKPEPDATFKQKNGLEPSYVDFLQFIVGPYTRNQGAEKKEDDIQIDWELTQLCLRLETIRKKFEEFMNPAWLSLPIPKDYNAIIKQNMEEKEQREKKHPDWRVPSNNFKRFGITKSWKKLQEFLKANKGKKQ